MSSHSQAFAGTDGFKALGAGDVTGTRHPRPGLGDRHRAVQGVGAEKRRLGKDTAERLITERVNDLSKKTKNVKAHCYLT